ncbi:MAG: protein kinase [Actinomycetaceae bacterium]|nr:protein kinase [Actinomycetaceae bacterium]MDY6082297.1 protein kinase [Actinomycetaceae bacterium]
MQSSSFVHREPSTTPRPGSDAAVPPGFQPGLFPLAAGADFGGYTIVRQIGAGGMSVVYEARDGNGTHVALKVLNPSTVAVAGGRERLAREVRMLQKVHGPFVAEVLDAELDEGAFIVTELIDGQTLAADVAENGVYSAHELNDLASMLAQALDSIHAAGVLHRDVKPSNVMMSEHGPVLIDFGIAQLGGDERLTRTGLVAQTPGYGDPRLLDGTPPDEEADWWAFAAVILYAAIGRDPFGSSNVATIVQRVTLGRADVDGLPPAVGSLFLAALAPRLEERLDHSDFVDAIARYAESPDTFDFGVPLPAQTIALAAPPVELPTPAAETQQADSSATQTITPPTQVYGLPTQLIEDSPAGVTPIPLRAYALSPELAYQRGERGAVADETPPQPLPDWLKPPRKATMLSLFVSIVLAAAAGMWPTVTAIVWGAAVLVAGIVGDTSHALALRRVTRNGPSRSDRWWILAHLPIAGFRSLFSSLLTMLATVAATVGVSILMRNTTGLRPNEILIVASWCGIVLAWWIAAGQSTKTGMRLCANAAAPTRSYYVLWIVFAALLAAIGIALSLQVYAPSWSPLTDVPPFLD